MSTRQSMLLLSLVFVIAIMVLSLATIQPVSAGERLLTINTGGGTAEFEITGERTLVMNGFDLTPIDVLRPAVIDRVSITVTNPVPGAPVEVVIYEDINGGSPRDARLVGRQTVTLDQVGSNTVDIDPVTVVDPVVWVGFYLPVGFKFLADTTGPSVLTYWAWTPESEFDLGNLSSAQIFGPSDGSAPVNLNLNGKALITAEITPANPLLGTPVIIASRQLGPNGNVNVGVLTRYEECENLQYDTADEFASYLDEINLHCEDYAIWNAPPVPNGYSRRQSDVYNVFLYTDQRIKPGDLPIFITHCMQPNAEDIDRAVIAVAYGAPLAWRILPTQRFDNLVCAELPHGGYVNLFVPSN